MPLFHIHGLAVNMLVPVLAEASILPLPVFTPDAFFAAVVGPAHPTYYSAVPAIHEQLLQHSRLTRTRFKARYVSKTHQSDRNTTNKYNLLPSSLRFLRNCSAALLPPVAAELAEVFDCDVLGTYAMTESMPICSNPSEPKARRRLDSVGPERGPRLVIRDNTPEVTDVEKATWSVEKIVDFVTRRRARGQDFTLIEDESTEQESATASGERIEGEVCVKGPMVTLGYERNLEDWRDCVNDYTSDGFLRTGDKGYRDQNGHIVLLGRYKEVINWGGEKLSPFLAESVAIQHPQVREVLAFSAPHAVFGEAVGFVVVSEDDPKRQLTTETLREFMRQHGMGVQYFPEVLVLMLKIPRAHTGKPQRIGLAKRIGLEATTVEHSGTREFFWRSVEAEEDGNFTLGLVPLRRGEVNGNNEGQHIVPRTAIIGTQTSPPAVVSPAPISEGSPESSSQFSSVMTRFGLKEVVAASNQGELADLHLPNILDSISIIQLRAVLAETFTHVEWPLHVLTQRSLAEIEQRATGHNKQSSSPTTRQGAGVSLYQQASDPALPSSAHVRARSSSPLYSQENRNNDEGIDIGTIRGVRRYSGDIDEKQQVDAAAAKSGVVLKTSPDPRISSSPSTKKAFGSRSEESSGLAATEPPLDENCVPASCTETRIAPTAILRGKVGRGCVVEDFAVIGPQVELGDQCFVGNYTRLQGRVRAGRGCVFYDNVSIGNPPQDFFGSSSAKNGKIFIGENCVFREYVSVNMPTREEGTRIGRGSMVHSHCNVGHDCVLGDRVNLNMNCYLSGFSQVLDDSTLSISCSLHQGVIVGPKCFIGMHVALTHDVPPFLAIARRERLTASTSIRPGESQGGRQGSGGSTSSASSWSSDLYSISVDREGVRRKMKNASLGGLADALESAYTSTTTKMTRGTSDAICDTLQRPDVEKTLTSYRLAREMRRPQLARSEVKVNTFFAPPERTQKNSCEVSSQRLNT
ncbi:unnamed protein product [Amoebophrya sp. A25]|nr:unnamed protein product [Amoebophrya sp. A25]|eukprot:GSA25T00001814001.1